ncbi:MAG TPA: protein kinase [Bryobacteraceae bacterium]|jgi:serine/threonine protein kinase|nr:protein kinase [Bryobacteraceae bacterium]
MRRLVSRIDHVKSLFHLALELPEGTDRAPWLQSRCAEDRILLEEVSSLLEAHAEMRRGPAAIPAAPAPAVPNAQFGSYRAVEFVGRGGMSTVYRARRADGRFEQTVAVKVMAGHLAGGDFLRRFETERQLLASLNHNHITRLLDGGVSSAGDPYLVTEFVEGETIDRYCDERKLPLEARLRIFLQVCDAVEYAHRNLIVHRDLKPGNILVNVEGAVKLLDFGTAAITQANSDVTVTRARMLTPRYASPEQLRGERLNTATDIFSLGVVLYELLTGAWPFGDPGSVLSELSRATGEVAAKPPSLAVTEEAAGSRSMPREQLGRMLRGDLSPIVLKALDNDPERRYKSVRAFAADIENYLAGRPVLARPQTALYRTGKFVRRRWLAVSSAAVFALGLSTATAVAIRQTRTARAEALKSDKVSRFLSNMLSSGTRFGTGYTVAQMLDATEPELEKSWHDDPLTEATLRMNLGASYTTLHQPDRARSQTEKALALFRAHADHRGTAIALWILGQIAGTGDLRNREVSFYEQARESLRRLGRKDVLWDFRVKRDLGNWLAWASHRRLDEARILLSEALTEAAGDPNVPAGEFAEAQAELGRILVDEGREQEAEASLRQALSAWRQATHGGDSEPALLGQMLLSSRKRDFAAAREFASRRYQLYHGDSTWAAQSQLDWARYRADTGEIAEAMAQVRAALPVIRKYPLHESQWRSLLPASHVLVKAGRFEEAERYARESLQVVEGAHREEVDSVRAESLEMIGTALSGQKKYREAIPVLEHARSIYAQLGPAFAKTADSVQARLREAQRGAGLQPVAGL